MCLMKFLLTGCPIWCHAMGSNPGLWHGHAMPSPLYVVAIRVFWMLLSYQPASCMWVKTMIPFKGCPMLVDFVSYWCSRNWETSLCDKYICLKFINANWLCQLIKTLGKYHFLLYRVLIKSWFTLHVLVLSILCLLSWQWVGKFPVKSVQNFHFFHCQWSSSFKLHFCHL
jgi:hypothetical protein